MNVKKMIESVKTGLSVIFVAGLLGWCIIGTGSDIVEGYTTRNESVYLIDRRLDPTFQVWGFTPDDVICESPARCEPNGRPSMRYNVLLKEHEVREWGLDPAQHRPFTGSARDLDWS